MMQPRWTCETCKRFRIITGERWRDMENEKKKLFIVCRSYNHESKPYYTAGFRL